jgi:hypothetical protein
VPALLAPARTLALLGSFLSSRSALLTRTAFAVTLILLTRLTSLTTLLLATLLLATLTLLIALMLLAAALALTLVVTLLHILRLWGLGRHVDAPAVIELQAHTRTGGGAADVGNFQPSWVSPDIDLVGLR